VSLRIPSAAAAALAAFGALASIGVAGDGARVGAALDGELVVSLATDGSFLQVGRPVPVKLTLENRGATPVEIQNGVLFGQGMKVNAVDAPTHTEVVLPETVAPADARHALTLPAGASLSATIDLATAATGLFATPGRYAVRCEVALAGGKGVVSTPLDVVVARDWTGFHAVLETAAGEIELEFFADQAPRTVANFLALAERGFYDGLTFHRIVKGFMIQGGDPKGDGSGTTGRFLPFEKTGVKHERGVISMARQRDFDTASCQFFLVQKAAPFLDGNYAAFGRIVRGLDVLDKLCDTPCVMNPNGTDSGPSKPREQVLIQKVRPVAPAGAK
jgi:cyclophilin family peptidyl-prolyl cis-trans isomerase